jgi:hypothetical protein
MKRLFATGLFVLLLAALVVSSASAQAKKGESVITAGVGFGYPGLYGTSSMPPIFLAFDHSVQNKFSVGGVVSYSSSSYEFTVDKWTYTYIFVGARGAYHFGEDLQLPSNTDLYGGITLGYNIVNWSYSGPNANILYYSVGGSYFQFGFYGGGRYFFSPRWGVTGELGYDALGFFKLGLSYKI